MDDYYIDSRNTIINTEKGIMDDDKMRCIQQNKPFTHYGSHMQENTTEDATEIYLQLLSQFLLIVIYIFLSVQDTNDFVTNNTEIIFFKTTILPFNKYNSSLPYIVVVRRGSHYDHAIPITSGLA